MSKKKNIHEGSSFEDFLKERGILEEIDAMVEKQILALEFAEIMKRKHISKAEMARRMGTPTRAAPRSMVYNVLDPNKDCTLSTIHKAAQAIGVRVRITLDTKGGKKHKKSLLEKH